MISQNVKEAVLKLKQVREGLDPIDDRCKYIDALYLSFASLCSITMVLKRKGFVKVCMSLDRDINSILEVLSGDKSYFEVSEELSGGEK